MVDLAKGWLKIYLFYGAIFFLLGLFGYLACDINYWTAWSARQIAGAQNFWTFNESPSKGEAVPAFASGSGAIILGVHRPKRDNPSFEALMGQLQTMLEKRYKQVIIVPVDNPDQPDFNSNPATPVIFVGYDQTAGRAPDGQNWKNSLFFAMPGPAACQLAGRFVPAAAARIPGFTLSKQQVGRMAVFGLHWESAGDHEPLSTGLFSALAEDIAACIIGEPPSFNLN